MLPCFQFQHGSQYTTTATVVGKVENGRGFFAAGGQTNGFSRFKVDSICLSMFPHHGYFGIGPPRPLSHDKLSGTKLKTGTCCAHFSINRQLVEPLIARPLTDSIENSCLMTAAYSRIQKAMSFSVRSLKASGGLCARRSATRPKCLF